MKQGMSGVSKSSVYIILYRPPIFILTLSPFWIITRETLYLEDIYIDLSVSASITVSKFSDHRR